MSKAAIRVLIKGGNVEMTAVSTTEDLWHDFEYFRESADGAAKDGRVHLHRRFLRATVWALYAYLEAVVNRWLSSLLKAEGKSDEDVLKDVRYTCLEKKCGLVSKSAQAQKKLSCH